MEETNIKIRIYAKKKKKSSEELNFGPNLRQKVVVVDSDPPSVAAEGNHGWCHILGYENKTKKKEI